MVTVDPPRIAMSDELADQVLALPLFQGLPPGASKLMRRFARVAQHPAGSEFVQQGEFTSDFHVVISGSVSALRTESDGEVRRLAELFAGDWFGELSALSNQPSPARLKAEQPTTLLTLEAGLFKDVHKSARTFRGLIDAQYLERSLETHLAVVPAFRELDRKQTRRLKRLADLRRVEAGTEIASSGEPVDAIYLVRSGAVTFHRDLGAAQGERLDGYLMDNSSFGESGLWEHDARWEGAYRANTTVELLALPIARIQAEFEGDPVILGALRKAAEAVTRADRGLGGDLHEDELHGMVHRGSVKGGEALVIDLEKCVRCNACVESCVAVHTDGVPRLSKNGFRVAPEANAMNRPVALVTSCYHCQTPGCMMACSYGAIRRDPQGLIRLIEDNCVGCAMCVSGCPYDVIRLTEPAGAAADEGQGSFLSQIPVIGKLLAKASESAGEAPRGFHKDAEAQGRAVKCDRCEGLPFEACVYNCPCNAISRRAPSEVFGAAAPGAGGRG